MSVQLFVVGKGAITYSVLRLCGGCADVPRIAIGWSNGQNALSLLGTCLWPQHHTDYPTDASELGILVSRDEMQNQNQNRLRRFVDP
jgi:hypothetical protein